MDEEKSILRSNLHRRQLMNGAVGTFILGCQKQSDWCSSPLLTSDGDFPTIENCKMTVEEIEGPYYFQDRYFNRIAPLYYRGLILNFGMQIQKENTTIHLRR